jgi:integrase
MLQGSVPPAGIRSEPATIAILWGCRDRVVETGRRSCACPPRRDGSARQGPHARRVCSGRGAAGAALIGAEGLHFHDLRHTGNTFAAAGGAGIKDVMARMGHDSERAALIYQHQARGADKLITNSIDAHVEAERKRKDDDDDGTAGVLVSVG